MNALLIILIVVIVCIVLWMSMNCKLSCGTKSNFGFQTPYSDKNLTQAGQVRYAQDYKRMCGGSFMTNPECAEMMNYCSRAGATDQLCLQLSGI